MWGLYRANVFEFADAVVEIPDEFADVCRRTWAQVAATGTWWEGRHRVAIAQVARAARRREPIPEADLPGAAVEVATMVGATPAQTTGDWAGEMVSALGEPAYVETASIASRVVAIDTFTRLVGSTLEPFPDPDPGEPSRQEAVPAPRQGKRTWVGTVGFPTPPNAFSAVPPEAAGMNDITDVFYMPELDMQYADYRRDGLHRTQIETVASVTSHANECFY
jgi:hypothetical protein